MNLAQTKPNQFEKNMIRRNKIEQIELIIIKGN